MQSPPHLRDLLGTVLQEPVDGLYSVRFAVRWLLSDCDRIDVSVDPSQCLPLCSSLLS